MRARASAILLLSLLGLTACGERSDPERLVPDDTVIIRSWQCETSDPDTPGLYISTAPVEGRLAERLLVCPFSKELQFEALSHESASDITSDELTELVTKIRWGLDYEYRLYEETVRNRVKLGRLVPRFVVKILPGSNFFNALIPDVTDNHIVVGPARDLIIRQMRADRTATAESINKKLAEAAVRKNSYPLWQAMIDLDAYAQAGSVNSAVESLETTLVSRSRAYSD